MKSFFRMMCAAGLVLVVGATPSAARDRRLSDKEVRALLDRIEQDADRFESSVKKGVDEGPLDDTWEEEEIRRQVERFEDAADRLEDRADDGEEVNALVQEVLRRAAFIDRFVAERPVGPIATSDWNTLRAKLDDLAAGYGVRWSWMFGTAAAVASAQRLSDEEMTRLVRAIEEDVDRFKDSFEDAADARPLDDTRAEREGDALMRGLDEAADHLRDRIDDEQQSPAAVSRLLWQAGRMEDFITRHRLGGRVQSSWEPLRLRLRELANSFGYEPRWSVHMR